SHCEHNTYPTRRSSDLKVMYKQLCKIDPSSQYKIALMLRDPRDIRESQKRAIGAAIYPAHDDRVYWYEMQELMKWMDEQPNISYVPIWAEDLIYSSVKTLSKLNAQNWPTDPEKASLAIEPELWKKWNS